MDSVKKYSFSNEVILDLEDNESSVSGLFDIVEHVPLRDDIKSLKENLSLLEAKSVETKLKLSNLEVQSNNVEKNLLDSNKKNKYLESVLKRKLSIIDRAELEIAEYKRLLEVSKKDEIAYKSKISELEKSIPFLLDQERLKVESNILGEHKKSMEEQGEAYSSVIRKLKEDAWKIVNKKDTEIKALMQKHDAVVEKYLKLEERAQSIVMNSYENEKMAQEMKSEIEKNNSEYQLELSRISSELNAIIDSQSRELKDMKKRFDSVLNSENTLYKKLVSTEEKLRLHEEKKINYEKTIERMSVELELNSQSLESSEAKLLSVQDKFEKANSQLMALSDEKNKAQLNLAAAETEVKELRKTLEMIRSNEEKGRESLLSKLQFAYQDSQSKFLELNKQNLDHVEVISEKFNNLIQSINKEASLIQSSQQKDVADQVKKLSDSLALYLIMGSQKNDNKDFKVMRDFLLEVMIKSQSK